MRVCVCVCVCVCELSRQHSFVCFSQHFGRHHSRMITHGELSYHILKHAVLEYPMGARFDTIDLLSVVVCRCTTRIHGDQAAAVLVIIFVPIGIPLCVPVFRASNRLAALSAGQRPVERNILQKMLRRRLTIAFLTSDRPEYYYYEIITYLLHPILMHAPVSLSVSLFMCAYTNSWCWTE